jgi:hypothetical protein
MDQKQVKTARHTEPKTTEKMALGCGPFTENTLVSIMKLIRPDHLDIDTDRELHEGVYARLRGAGVEITPDLMRFVELAARLYSVRLKYEQKLEAARKKLYEDGSNNLSPYQQQLLLNTLDPVLRNMDDDDAFEIEKLGSKILGIVDILLGHKR